MHPIAPQEGSATTDLSAYLAGRDDEPAEVVLRRSLAATPLGSELLEKYSTREPHEGGPWGESSAAVLERSRLIAARRPDLHPAYVAAEAILSTPGTERLLGFDDFEVVLGDFQSRFGHGLRRRTARVLTRRAREAAAASRVRHVRILWRMWTRLVAVAGLIARGILVALLAPGVACREGLRVLGGLVGGWGAAISGGPRDALDDLRRTRRLPGVREFRRFVLAPSAVLALLSVTLLVALRWHMLGTGSPILRLRSDDIQRLQEADLAPSVDEAAGVLALNLTLSALAVWFAYSLAAAVVPSAVHLERGLDDARLQGSRLGWLVLQPLRWVRRIMRPVDWSMDKLFGTPFLGSGLLLFGALMVVADFIVDHVLL